MNIYGLLTLIVGTYPGMSWRETRIGSQDNPTECIEIYNKNRPGRQLITMTYLENSLSQKELIDLYCRKVWKTNMKERD